MTCLTPNMMEAGELADSRRLKGVSPSDKTYKSVACGSYGSNVAAWWSLRPQTRQRIGTQTTIQHGKESSCTTKTIARPVRDSTEEAILETTPYVDKQLH